MNAIDLARNIGEIEYKRGGAMWMPELEVAYLLSTLGGPGNPRPYYDNSVGARLRRHVLMVAPRGWLKGTVSKRFIHGLTPAKDVIDLDESLNRDTPFVLNLSGQGISWPAMRGSVTRNGNVLTPLMALTDIYWAEELLSFLGSKVSQNDSKMEVMNEVLETGTVTISLVKMKDTKREAILKARQDWEDMGIKVKYNRASNMMQYKASGFFIGCTRPIEDDLWQKFEDSGLLSRMSIVRWDVSSEEALALPKSPLGPENNPASAKYADQLLALNKKAWGVQWGKVPYPPQDYVEHVYKDILSLVEDMVDQFGIDAREIVSARIIPDIAQVITAFAVARTLEGRDTTNDGWYIKELEYVLQDRDKARDYMEGRRKQLWDEWMEEAKLDPMKSKLNATIHGFGRNLDPRDPTFSGREWVYFVETEHSKSQGTAYNWLSKMRELGWVRQIKQNLYTITDAIPIWQITDEYVPTYDGDGVSPDEG